MKIQSMEPKEVMHFVLIPWSHRPSSLKREISKDTLREEELHSSYLSATFSSGVGDNKTALLKISWKWIEH